MSKRGFGKFILGAGIGAGLALLFAPKKGSEMRKELKKKIDEFMCDVNKMTIEDIRNEFTKKVEEVKEGLEDLDKEKVLKVAKDKAKELKDKVAELTTLAKEKGTPVLEGIANDLKDKTLAAVKEVIEKLEK